MNDDIGKELTDLTKEVNAVDMTERAYAGARRLGLRRMVLGTAVIVALMGGGVAGAVTLWPTGSQSQPTDGGDECATETPVEERGEPTDEDASTELPTDEDTVTETPTDEPGSTEAPTEEPSSSATDEPSSTEVPTEEPSSSATGEPSSSTSDEPTQDEPSSSATDGPGSSEEPTTTP